MDSSTDGHPPPSLAADSPPTGKSKASSLPVDPPARPIVEAVRNWTLGLATSTLAIVDRPQHRAKDVHEIRLTVKRLRALWQMLRPATTKEHLRAESRQLSEVARLLAPDREAHVMRQMLKHLRKRTDKKKNLEVLALMLERVVEPSVGALSPIQAYAEFIQQRLHLGIESCCRTLDEVTDDAQLFTGAQFTFAKAQRRGAEAYARDEAEAYHRWRKWVKYLQYQLEILAPGGEPMHQTAAALEELGKILGRAHDMASLREAAENRTLPVDDARVLRRIVKMASRRERELIESTRPLNDLALSKSPDAFRLSLVELLEGPKPTNQQGRRPKRTYVPPSSEVL